MHGVSFVTKMEETGYEKLKEEIIKYAGNNVDLQYLKQELQKVVSLREGDPISKRSLHRVVCVGDLLRLLENRDCLNDSNVEYLELIANILPDRKSEILGLIKTFKKLCGLAEPRCKICSRGSGYHHLETTNISPHGGYFREYEVPQCVPRVVPQCVPHQPVPQQKEDDMTYLLRNRCSELNMAIEALVPRLDWKWTVLVRELGMKEGHIMKVRTKFSDLQKQAKYALDFWSISDASASVDKLHTALSSSECQRRGLSPQLTVYNQYVRLLM